MTLASFIALTGLALLASVLAYFAASKKARKSAEKWMDDHTNDLRAKTERIETQAEEAERRADEAQKKAEAAGQAIEAARRRSEQKNEGFVSRWMECCPRASEQLQKSVKQRYVSTRTECCG